VVKIQTLFFSPVVGSIATLPSLQNVGFRTREILSSNSSKILSKFGKVKPSDSFDLLALYKELYLSLSILLFNHVGYDWIQSLWIRSESASGRMQHLRIQSGNIDLIIIIHFG